MDLGQNRGQGCPRVKPPPSAVQEAGKVTREIPRGRLDRRGQGLSLNINDAVEWEDQIHTFESGRLQITLTDGSLLSVGSHSEMKVARHAGDTQQTQMTWE
ncbi:MAG: FecR family protein [Acidobacteriota bacterium]|nr:FecR family protein [Acidobacteriota bacterium]